MPICLLGHPASSFAFKLSYWISEERPPLPSPSTQDKDEETETLNMDSAEKRRPLGSGVATGWTKPLRGGKAFHQPHFG